ncbi:hypothetical protein J437_LFUL001339 [Ladona fulva]|uniref:Uncharacterized protein n=1 Tax=Ladona fulva TaxID=123851 RepID=A0A8K0NUQ0_LADFU|nr:hypothetical protein J437_LFUL001339 [Ladona fulva]
MEKNPRPSPPRMEYASLLSSPGGSASFAVTLVTTVPTGWFSATVAVVTKSSNRGACLFSFTSTTSTERVVSDEREGVPLSVATTVSIWDCLSSKSRAAAVLMVPVNGSTENEVTGNPPSPENQRALSSPPSVARSRNSYTDFFSRSNCPDTVNTPLTGSTLNSSVSVSSEYVILALSPRSASLALARNITVPLVAFSGTSKLATDLSNLGALSFTSNTATGSIREDDLGGLPRSHTVMFSTYSSSRSRSNLPMTLITPVSASSLNTESVSPSDIPNTIFPLYPRSLSLARSFSRDDPIGTDSLTSSCRGKSRNSGAWTLSPYRPGIMAKSSLA